MNDCQSCGACCVQYDVVDVYEDDPNFEWLKENGYLKGERMKMRGDRCSALRGTVGKKVECSIYEHRPTGCQKYEVGGPRCRTAVFICITRKGKELFEQGVPESWPTDLSNRAGMAFLQNMKELGII